MKEYFVTFELNIDAQDEEQLEQIIMRLRAALGSTEYKVEIATVDYDEA